MLFKRICNPFAELWSTMVALFGILSLVDIHLQIGSL